MKDRKTEIQEAIGAADEALRSLNRAKQYLESADHWGIWDMIGGGILSTFMKHSKMREAEQALEQAKSAMRRFASEMRDIHEAVGADLRTDDFLGFADYFFDGWIADWMMLSRIGRARDQIAEAIRRVDTIRKQLVSLL